MRRICRQCHSRPASYKQGKEIRADNQHDLCRQCYRSKLDALLSTQVGRKKG